jgi:hypothetical protein
MGYQNSANVPKGLPERIQFLFFLGSPDAQGNVKGIDTRFLNPLRDVANYMSLTGYIQALNPILLAPFAMIDPSIIYGGNSLYPNMTYDQLYGIATAPAQGNALTGLQQITPQLGALSDAFSVMGSLRSTYTKNPNTFYKHVFESLNIPMFQIQNINVKQIAASDAIARYQVAKQAATNAFDSGQFSQLAGYSSVPYPMNADYTITPEALQALYNQALQTYPGEPPSSTITPPRTPSGF